MQTKCGFYYENKYKRAGFGLVFGVDEVGRGSLAGPVVAAAVLLGKSVFSSRIDDSKKLTPLQRERAFLEITASSQFGLGIVHNYIIDRINILSATRIAMERAVFSLLDRVKSKKKKPRIHILVDGNVNIDVGYPFTNIIGGDAKSKSIAAASIVAKVTRDRMMVLYDKVYPEYQFLRHKGYGTQLHRDMIKKIGLSVLHRTSFCSV